MWGQLLYVSANFELDMRKADSLDNSVPRINQWEQNEASMYTEEALLKDESQAQKRQRGRAGGNCCQGFMSVSALQGALPQL